MQTEVMHYLIQNWKKPEIIIEFPRSELTSDDGRFVPLWGLSDFLSNQAGFREEVHCILLAQKVSRPPDKHDSSPSGIAFFRSIAIICDANMKRLLWRFCLNVSNDSLHNDNMFIRFISVDHMHALYISHNININIRDTTYPPKLLQKLTSKSTKVEITNSKGLIKCSKESSESPIFFWIALNYAHTKSRIQAGGALARTGHKETEGKGLDGASGVSAAGWLGLGLGWSCSGCAGCSARCGCRSISHLSTVQDPQTFSCEQCCASPCSHLCLVRWQHFHLCEWQCKALAHSLVRACFHVSALIALCHPPQYRCAWLLVFWPHILCGGVLHECLSLNNCCQYASVARSLDNSTRGSLSCSFLLINSSAGDTPVTVRGVTL